MGLSHRSTKILMLILVLISIVLLIRFFYFEYNLLKYPYQWELLEALQLNHAIILSEGKPLYSINKEPPISFVLYGPLNPAIIAPLLKIFGNNFFAPRLVSFISFLLLQFLISYTVFILTRSWIFVFLSIGLNTFMSHWWQWLLLCRPDSLGTLLLFSSIFLHWKLPYKRKAIFFSLLSGLLAFFAKSYFICGFGSIILSYWFVHKDKKMALLYLIFSSGLFITAALTMNYITNGLYYLFTFEMQSMILTYSLNFLIENNLKPLMFSHLPIFILILYNISRKSFDYKRYGVFFIQLLIGLPFVSILLLNRGGGAYYWYVIIPFLIVIGCDLIYLEHKRISNQKLLVFVLLMMIIIMLYKTVYRDTIRNEFVIPSSELAQKWEPLQKLVKNTQGEVMNSNETAILNIHAGKKLYTEGMGYLTSRSYLQSKYKYSFIDINKEIAQKRYALIINPEEELKPHVMKYYKLYKTYIVPGQFGRWKLKINVFIPRY